MAIIDKPSDYFNTKLTTGTGSSQAVTGVGFQPDWIWGKRRDSTGNNSLFDAVRGITKGLESNSAGAEFTSTDYYSSFDSDGFTIAAGSGGAGNGSGQTAVQWLWKANGAGSANTDGSISSTVSANTTSGFSIVSYTGTGSAGTVGHGLGSVPKMIIVKRRSEVSNWDTYNSNLGNNKVIELNTTSAAYTDNTWNSTTPTSSVFTVGNNNVNGNSVTHIAYCFAEKQGYSKFGSYVGNGSDDGTFVYTGFKPAFVMSKCTSHAGEDWNINDDKRPGHNVIQNALLPNSSAAEVTASYQAVDTLSNGFKWRGSNDRVNASGKTYIYMAFAEAPLVGSNNVPATAR
jgi:hypothetical protein